LKAFGVTPEKGRGVFGVEIRLVNTNAGSTIRAETDRRQKSMVAISAQDARGSLDDGDLAEPARDVADQLLAFLGKGCG